MSNQTRQLAAIMFTDIVGYTALMGEDEEKAFELLKKNRLVQRPIIEKYNGRWIKEIGDGILASFPAVSDAVYCAKEIQETCREDVDLKLRIGIHQGEVVFEGDDVFGDGVNIASRLEPLAPIGGILVSESVNRNLGNKKELETQFIREEKLRNVKQPVRIYEVKIGSHHPIKTSNNYPSKSGSELKISEKSIAVLPFVNMSSDPEQEHFCEGISEEIINTIVQLPNLKVAGRTSSFSFKGKNEDLRSVGKKLGVSNILEGSVRKVRNRVRITAQLVEATTGFHLWSKKYDRELVDVFKIQDEIALEIANQLQVTLKSSETIPKSREQTQSIEAYQLYYKGRSLYYQRGAAMFEGLRCFQASLEIDPNYALAYSGLADALVMLCFHGYLSPDKCWIEAIPAAQKAYKFGPNLGEIHNTLGIIALTHDRNIEVAKIEFLKALEINPTHLQAQSWYGLFYLTITRQKTEVILEHLKIATINDPLSPYAHANYALTLASVGKFKQSISSGEYAVKLNPDAWTSRAAMGYCYLLSGQFEKALQEYQIALNISDRSAWSLHLILITYLKMNQRDEALKIFNEMEVRYQDHYLPPSNLAIAAAALGNDGYALELAHTSLNIIDPYLSFTATIYPDSEVLRSVPGFEGILEQLGYSKTI